MKDAIDWILRETEATNVQWKRLKVAPKVASDDNALGATYEAKCAKEANQLFKKAYVGLRGQKEIISLVIMDLEGKWHFVDVDEREVGQQIEETFSSFFDKRCFVNIKNKSV